MTCAQEHAFDDLHLRGLPRCKHHGTPRSQAARRRRPDAVGAGGGLPRRRIVGVRAGPPRGCDTAAARAVGVRAAHDGARLVHVEAARHDQALVRRALGAARRRRRAERPEAASHDLVAGLVVTSSWSSSSFVAVCPPPPSPPRGFDVIVCRPLRSSLVCRRRRRLSSSSSSSSCFGDDNSGAPRRRVKETRALLRSSSRRV